MQRRVRAGMTAAMLLTALVGCSEDGNVFIKNNTGTEFVGEINGRGFALSGFESIELTVKIGTRFLIFGPNEKDVVFEGESCTKFPFREMVTVEGGTTRDVGISPDAICVRIQNQGEFEVEAVYQRDHGTFDWGESLISSSLFTTESLELRLAPGRYDYLMVDACDDSTVSLSDSTDVIRGTIRWVVHQTGTGGCPLP